MGAIRAIERKLDTDAAKPRSQPTLREREIVETEISNLTKAVNIVDTVRIVAKVTLPLGFLYWAFNVGMAA